MTLTPVVDRTAMRTRRAAAAAALLVVCLLTAATMNPAGQAHAAETAAGTDQEVSLDQLDTSAEQQTAAQQADATASALPGDAAAEAASGQPAADAEEAADVSEPTRTVCTVYRPRECWYHVSDPDRPPATPPCAQNQDCGFNLTERLACPLWQSGTFDSVETEERCSTPYAEEAERPPGTCDRFCCAADAEDGGAWVQHPTFPGHKVFEPPGCAYYQYTRRQVQEHFQQNNVDIVLVGDSIVRQLFARAVHMLRGQERVVEYRIHTHASYATCETEDRLRIAGSYTPKLAADRDAQAELVPDFFRLPANDSDGDPLWAGCQSRPMQIHYMYGALFRQQTQHLRQWIEADELAGPQPVKLDFIVSVMFWTATPFVSQNWLDMLERLQAAPSTRTVYMLGIPTARVPDPNHITPYQTRNRVMREWANNRTAAGVLTPFLDFDAWSMAPDVPGACAKGNKHYACHLRVEIDEQSGINYWREPLHNAAVGDFWSSEDGECFDDMNAQVWQAYFNIAMNQRSADAEATDEEQPLRPLGDATVKARSQLEQSASGYAHVMDRMWTKTSI